MRNRPINYIKSGANPGRARVVAPYNIILCIPIIVQITIPYVHKQGISKRTFMTHLVAIIVGGILCHINIISYTNWILIKSINLF